MCWSHSWRMFELFAEPPLWTKVRVCRRCGCVQETQPGRNEYEAVHDIARLSALLHLHLSQPQAKCYEEVPIEHFSIRRITARPEKKG